MGLMNYLRNRAGVVIVAFIGFAIVAFLLGDVVSYGTPFWARNQNQVGNVNGESIDIAEFNAHVDQTTEMFRQQMGGNMSPQMRGWAVEQVWSQFVNRELLNAEVEKIGLTVDRNELNDLVQGEHPSSQILQAFSDPQTGQFDRAQLNMFVSQVRELPGNHEAVAQWNALLENIVAERLSAKFNDLVNNCVYVTGLEANEDYIQRNKLANFDYILLDYSSVSDEDVTVTDADYKAYYDEHRKSFVNPEETREIEFVIFDASPVAADTARVREQVEALAMELAQAANDSLFAAVNSDTKYPFVYQRSGTYSTELDSLLSIATPGSVVGPIYSNGAFEIAKVVDSKMSPDSIKASHILLNPTVEGGLDKAQAKADSIRQLIQQGESFAALALQFSVDEGSKINGGELGTFARGMMVPAFEEPVFAGRKGEVLVLNTQFGIHIVKIEDVVGFSRVVKAAIIDKYIVSGKETIDAAYAKATDFFSAIEKNNLNELAAERGLQVQKATGVNAREQLLLGIPVKRELVRWAFEADLGEVSDKIYESENSDQYLVARVSGIKRKGQQSLQDVRSEIAREVLKRAKADKLVADIKAAASGAGSVTEIASKLGVTTQTAEHIVQANPIIPGVAVEPAVVGTVFGSELRTPSAPIRGTQGVYVVEVSGFVNPQTPDDLTAHQEQMEHAQRQRTWSALFRALHNQADIVDHRDRFF